MKRLEELNYSEKLKADCKSCNRKDVTFDYLGFQNVPEEIGDGFLLYNCRNCGSTRVLEDESLNDDEKDSTCGKMTSLQEKDQEKKGITGVINSSLVNKIVHSTLVAGYFGLAAFGFWNFIGYTTVDCHLREHNNMFTQEKVQRELEKINQMETYEKIFHLGSKKAFKDYLEENKKVESFINK